jgi:two-component system, chemotaxis family, protein-glutamate methylesterase/glutaminase
VAFQLVVVGTSLGGLAALQTLLAGLPAEFPVPLVVVQHRAADSGDTLKTVLQRYSRLKVREPQDKEPILPGCVYLAPADYHLLVEEGGFALSTEAPVSHARPSVDVLFESAADTFGERLVGVVLTGANRDGAVGAARIKERGGFVVVEDPESAESGSMPRHAIAGTMVDMVLPLSEIAPFLDGLCSYACE